jgi:hypothetical protein
VHVAYLVIDAVIDVPWARERFKQKPDEFFIAGGHRRRVVARGAPGPFGMVVQCRSAALRRELVGLGWRGDAA